MRSTIDLKIPAVWLLAVSLPCLSGCQNGATTQPAVTQLGQNPTPEQIARMRDPNVLGVSAHYNSFDPWLWNESRERPRGIKVSIYLLNEDYKGTFGDGIIRPRLYVREFKDGKSTWVLAKEWSFTPEETVPWRSRQRRVWGWGYGLLLVWEDLAKLAGREVRMIIEFERADGRRVSSGKHDLRVPGLGET